MLLSDPILSTSDWIQLLAIAVSLLGTIVAIIIAVHSNIQTKRMTYEASKPIINVSLEYFQDYNKRDYYLCIKNVGASSALITSITHSPANIFTQEEVERYLKTITPCSLNPGEKLITSCLLTNYEQPIHFDISYTWIKKKFKQTTILNPLIVFRSAEPTPKELTPEEAIIHASRQIIRHNF
ncbi:hypothetical protein [Turicibacter sanguinis]|uniref:hypothetical protein n=1 Tax=Turicibacter sanguinis TaxID=154288 RepID=UPI0006C6A521|nr:hypothetical protein [Turicibacter sanguinis]CUN14657.1 Uncharacterised protein [Turicibacter sanguinis]